MANPTEINVPPELLGDVPASFAELMAKAGEGNRAALQSVVATINASPSSAEVWEILGNSAKLTERCWIDATSFGNRVVQVAIERTVARMRAELAGPHPTPLEALLVERIIACWLQVQHADQQYGKLVQDDSGRHTFDRGDYYQRRQERAGRRYLAAIRALAVVRRLLTPAVQVNIAKRRITSLAADSDPVPLLHAVHP